MTVFNSYSTGTVSVPNGGTTITGVGSIWSGVNAKPGDDIVIAGLAPVVVMDVTDTTHLTIDPWPFATQTAVTYKIIHRSPLRYVGGQAMADVDTMLATLNSLGPIFNVDPADSAPDPSWGRDGQYATKITTGEWWLKTAGVWVVSGGPSASASLTANNTFSGTQNFTNATAPTSATTGAFKAAVLAVAGVAFFGGDVQLENASAGAVGPQLTMVQNSASPALSDYVAKIVHQGKTSTGVTVTYGEFDTVIFDPNNATSGSYLALKFRYNNILRDDALLLGYHSGTALEYVFHWYDNVSPYMYLESSGTAQQGVQQVFWFDRNGVVNDILGSILWDGRNSSGTYTAYNRIESIVTNVTAGAETAYMKFVTRGGGTQAEAMRLDGNGLLTFGGFANSFGAILETPGNPTSKVTMATIAYGAHASGNTLFFLKTRHATLPGTHTIVQSGDNLGGTNWKGSDGSAFQYAAQMFVEVDGTPGAADMPGRFIWKTSPDGSATPAERMRLDALGQLTLGGAGANVFGARLELVSDPTVISHQSLIAIGAHGSGPSIFLMKTRHATIPGNQTIVSNGDEAGNIIWRVSDGVSFKNVAAIQALVDGGIAANDTPGRLEFKTTTDGTTTLARRLLLDALGNVVVNNAALATNAANGFLYVPTCAGTPTGTPTTYTGMAPIIVNTTNNKLYFYSSGAWRDAGP